MKQLNLLPMSSCYLKTKAPITHTVYEIMNYVTHLSIVISNSWKFRKIFVKLLETEFSETSKDE